MHFCIFCFLVNFGFMLKNYSYSCPFYCLTVPLKRVLKEKCHESGFSVSLNPYLCFIPRFSIDQSTDQDQIFNIDPVTGSITLGKILDRETAGWHNITVTVVEAGTNPVYCTPSIANEFSQVAQILFPNTELIPLKSKQRDGFQFNMMFAEVLWVNAEIMKLKQLLCLYRTQITRVMYIVSALLIDTEISLTLVLCWKSFS